MRTSLIRLPDAKYTRLKKGSRSKHSEQQKQLTMNLKPHTGTLPLDKTIWQKVNSRMLAKSIAELMHEQMAQPAIVSEDEDGKTHFLLSTDEPGVYYTFAGYKRRLDYWHIEPNSIQRYSNDGIGLATDAPLFFIELQTTFGINSFTLAHYVEELLHTLYADAFMHTRGRPMASELAVANYQTVEYQMDGHPWVIVNKSRLGFNCEDHKQYAPEANQPVQLLWLAAHKSRATFRSLDQIQEASFFEQELNATTIDAFKKTLIAN